mmetsp:Transcript_23580/g.60232  ORF Transcript_23580/g.60232 Transcript_23580/m.60232 type:complete len:289 (-) Transcript_23580:444-1310(-)
MGKLLRAARVWHALSRRCGRQQLGAGAAWQSGRSCSCEKPAPAPRALPWRLLYERRLEWHVQERMHHACLPGGPGHGRVQLGLPQRQPGASGGHHVLPLLHEVRRPTRAAAWRGLGDRGAEAGARGGRRLPRDGAHRVPGGFRCRHLQRADLRILQAAGLQHGLSELRRSRGQGQEPPHEDAQGDLDEDLLNVLRGASPLVAGLRGSERSVLGRNELRLLPRRGRAVQGGHRSARQRVTVGAGGRRATSISLDRRSAEPTWSNFSSIAHEGREGALLRRLQRRRRQTI